jgi:predicted permease
MSWVGGLRARAWLLLSGRKAEARMDEEFRFHVEMEIDKRVREGMDPAEARRQALIAFGGVERHKEMMRDGRGGRWLGDFLRDVRFAIRAAAKDRGFTFMAALIIAVGVGATTAVFTLVNAVLLRPLPVPAPERLYALTESRVGAVAQSYDGTALPYARYVAYRDATTAVFSGLAAQRSVSFALRAGGETTSVRGALTSGNYFGVLEVHPALGRFFTADDDDAVVLSNAMWRDRFGSDPAVVGRTIWLDGLALPVVGVAPPGFVGTNPMQRVDLWVPIVAARRAQGLTSMASWMFLFGRLGPGVPVARADALVDAVAKRVPPNEPQSRVHGARLESMNGLFRGDARTMVGKLLAMILCAAALVLLIACANVAGMLSARGVSRRREVAIRRAIGAGRGRLIRQLLTESALLAVIGGAGGVLIAETGARLAKATNLFGTVDVTPDLRVLGFALALTSVTAVLFGLLPALQTSRPDVVGSLKDGGWRGGTRSGTGRSVFVAGQLALAICLLVLAGLFVHSFQRASNVALGYDPGGVVVATTDLGPRGYDEARGRAFYSALEEGVRALPGVESAALAQYALLGAYSGNDMRNTESGSDERYESGVGQVRVDTAFLSTVRMPIVAGRGFTKEDARGAPLVAIVNESLARRFWPGQRAVGKSVRTMGKEMRVVGVVRDGLYDFRAVGLPAGFALFPFAQQYARQMTLHVRLYPNTRPAEVIRGIRGVVRSLDPDVAVQDAGPLSVPASRVLEPQRLLSLFLTLFGLVGILLSGLGVFGTLSFQVAQRSREFGIRVALGAPRHSVVSSVVRRTAAVGVVGAGIGLVASAGAAVVLHRFLYGVGVVDPLTLLSATLILLAVALIASFVPVRRAMRVDPVVVLRAE